MATLFHAWLYGRFIEIQNNLMRNKFHRTSQNSYFLGASFSNRDNVKPPFNLEEKVNPSILKDYFSSRTDLSNEVSQVLPALKSTSHFLS